jgi:formylglycine-generating enzyme required for sulfatase activity
MPFTPFKIHPKLEKTELVLVPGGTFMRGSNDPVKLQPFAIGKYPVTQELWEAVMGANPSYFKGKHRPVEQVSWEDTQLFLEKLNQDGRLAPGQQFRLPSEAEWEYAARGGKFSQGYQYAGSEKLAEVGWYDENSHGETKPVGLKAPNELDIHDMSGNVWEWCADQWHGSYEGASNDNTAWVDSIDKGASRVNRGGGWFGNARSCRATYRDSDYPSRRYSLIGFRVVLFPPPVSRSAHQ